MRRVEVVQEGVRQGSLSVRGWLCPRVVSTCPHPPASLCSPVPGSQVWKLRLGCCMSFQDENQQASQAGLCPGLWALTKEGTPRDSPAWGCRAGQAGWSFLWLAALGSHPLTLNCPSAETRPPCRALSTQTLTRLLQEAFQGCLALVSAGDRERGWAQEQSRQPEGKPRGPHSPLGPVCAPCSWVGGTWLLTRPSGVGEFGAGPEPQEGRGGGFQKRAGQWASGSLGLRVVTLVF